jgi:hypothetical protein
VTLKNGAFVCLIPSQQIPDALSTLTLGNSHFLSHPFRFTIRIHSDRYSLELLKRSFNKLKNAKSNVLLQFFVIVALYSLLLDILSAVNTHHDQNRNKRIWRMFIFLIAIGLWNCYKTSYRMGLQASRLACMTQYECFGDVFVRVDVYILS